MKTKTWDTNTVVTTIQQILNSNTTLANAAILVGQSYGDYCSDNVVVYPNKDNTEIFITMQGFNTEEPIAGQPNPEVEFVELQDSTADSRGGLQSKDKTVRDLYHTIDDALTALGYEVVPSLSPYF